MAKRISRAEIAASLKKEFTERINSTLNAMTKAELVELGDDFIEDMKSDIAKGISPIQGRGRFPGYKNPENYPDQVRNRYANKRRRPVNLKLSGDFLKSLKSIVKSIGARNALFIGFNDRKSKLKEEGHRDGANGQLKRPIIPEGSETFTPKLVKRFRDALVRAINKKLAK